MKLLSCEGRTLENGAADLISRHLFFCERTQHSFPLEVIATFSRCQHGSTETEDSRIVRNKCLLSVFCFFFNKLLHSWHFVIITENVMVHFIVNVSLSSPRRHLWVMSVRERSERSN